MGYLASSDCSQKLPSSIRDGRELKVSVPKWAAPLYEPHRFKGVYGGRGSGKSHAVATALITNQLLWPDDDIVCLRRTNKSIKKSIKELLEKKIYQHLGVEDYFSVQRDCIKSTGGMGEITFGGMLTEEIVENLKSLEDCKICLIEEGHFTSQPSLDILIPTIRQEGSEFWAIWNPRNEFDPINVMFRGENRRENMIAIEVNYHDNPWFTKENREEMEFMKVHDYAKYRHEWLGEYFKVDEAAVFKNWSVESFDTPIDVDLKFGLDFGFSVDPTVLVRSWSSGRKVYVDHEAYKIGCEIQDLPSLLLTVPDSEKWPIIADSARPETISYLQRNGFPKVMSAVKGTGSVQDGVEWLRGMQIIIHPRCENAIREVGGYSYKVDILTGTVLPTLDGKNDHSVDALRYAHESTRRLGEEIREVRAMKKGSIW